MPLTSITCTTFEEIQTRRTTGDAHLTSNLSTALICGKLEAQEALHAKPCRESSNQKGVARGVTTRLKLP